MKETTIHLSRKISHIILVILSMILSVNLFIQFSDYVLIQILFATLAVSLELLKLYLLVLAKSNFLQRDWKKEFVASFQFLVYGGLAFISIIASLGFTLVSIEEQSLNFETRQEVSSFRIDHIVNQIDINNRQIEIIQENATRLEFSAVERNELANIQVKNIQSQNENLITRLEALRNLQSETVSIETHLTSSDMFTLLGETINLEGKDTMFYMMLLFVILLEIAIAITSGHIDVKSVLSLSSINIFEYIDALFSGDKKYLISDSKIANKTNTSKEKCLIFKKHLKTITYKGKSMIMNKRGGSIANFSKENMKKIIQFHIDSGEVF